MTRSPSRRRRLPLGVESYRRLHQQVLERDGWRCQHCGRLDELQVHHIQLRSRLGDDAESNLITLCAKCHQDAHQRGGDMETTFSGRSQTSARD